MPDHVHMLIKIPQSIQRQLSLGISRTNVSYTLRERMVSGNEIMLGRVFGHDNIVSRLLDETRKQFESI